MGKKLIAEGCIKLLLSILPIVQISIGAIYLDECPVQAKIPIYLIVSGVTELVLNFTSCMFCNIPDGDNWRKLKQGCTILKSILTMFFFCWFITGNAWIYSIYEPSYSKNATDVSSYCNKTVYLFSFWITTLVYILLGLFLLAGCIFLSGYFLCHEPDADDVDNINNDNDNDSVPATIP
ncbi:transmembrane protein 272-like [Fundulus heteroclitus]|uniref:transmembrane protein 272-like n=1 Tax=Fundulus heteroclitus TaxID=8078 RepID=UPI00165AF4BF|nr:transmembrane protein 272-like [Fundulus heteroclitus]